MTTDAAWMALALAEGRQARRHASPNPAVGAVVVRDGALVGQGHTQPPGGPHAEVMALRQAGERARGATLYVTLEPCSMWGRTPPCVGAVLAAGVRRVVCALIDPDPRVRGAGVRALRQAGVAVAVGLGGEEAARDLAGFITQRLLGRPLVHVKVAASLDGRIAAVSGDARWVTGATARAHVHQLRADRDAILVGSGTALADDPLLTARPAEGAPARQPLRVLLDGRGRTPPTAKLFGDEARTLVFTATVSSEAWRTAVAASGAEVVVTPRDAAGQLDLAAVLAELGQRGVLSVLVEGGGTVLGGLFDAALVDLVSVHLAPIIVGGAAPAAVGGRGAWRLADARRLTDVTVEHFGEDVALTGYLRQPWRDTRATGAPLTVDPAANENNG